MQIQSSCKPQLLLATMAGQERGSKELHRTELALPLATMAGQESKIAEGASWIDRAWSHHFIGEDSVALPPVLLQPQEQKQSKTQP
jgi:hypothetical protein